ncbi:FtsX-like permease family protein [Marinobacter halophilus]|uniref:ABC transporter permease n=1 Tax=Marinobacter halophilus TaxID=1323740 RepID=A0A2T1KJK7_9GAMM|nr:FtsX-like permease family protein [Marinobacter halophilus]PSF10190.1 ABC transporter permease [Marinobacter halophilus]GGC68486.1 ABC transporter permease [Marinobacter halophilus]
MTTFTALLSHYRRHPWQGAALALLMLLATTLWTGIHHLTSEARASLGQSERAVEARHQVQRIDGAVLTVEDFVSLRRQGLCLMPWLEVLPEGESRRVIGVDPLAALCFQRQGDVASFDGQPLRGDPFLDIADAAALPARQSQLFLIVAPNTGVLPEAYRITSFSLAPDTGQLGDSFLLNLDALSVLVLLITGLLLRSVYLLSLSQRRDSFALLNRFGVPVRRVRWHLVAELVCLALLTLIPGILLGQLLANGLAGGFASVMEGLFDSRQFATSGNNWLVPTVVMMALLLLVCAADWLIPDKLRKASVFVIRSGLLALLFIVVGTGGVWLAPNLLWLFVSVALGLAGAGLLMPWCLSALSSRMSRASHQPLRRWWWAEFGVLCRRLALPLVALQLALAMVLAVQALVTTFEATFDHWLGQRLSADYYLEVPTGADAEIAAHWLTQNLPATSGARWHRVLRGQGRIGLDSQSRSVDVFALAPVGSLVTEWDLIEQTEQPWQQLAAGHGVMLNEQLAYRQGLAAGDQIQLELAGQSMSVPVLGIYPDYGRPAGEVLMAGDLLPDDFSVAFESFSISPGSVGIETITEALAGIWQQPALTLRDNRSIRDLANRVFDQTFMLTRAMTLLTLALAAVALLLMGWVFLATRLWYFRLLEVWGLERAAIFLRLLTLALAVSLSAAVLALPVGVGLTWVLVQRINPLAFGWSLPMELYPGFWLELLALALVIGVCIALLMRRQLGRPAVRPSVTGTVTGEER